MMTMRRTITESFKDFDGTNLFHCAVLLACRVSPMHLIFFIACDCHGFYLKVFPHPPKLIDNLKPVDRKNHRVVRLVLFF